MYSKYIFYNKLLLEDKRSNILEKNIIKELSILNNINHPNIIKLNNVYIQYNIYYLEYTLNYNNNLSSILDIRKHIPEYIVLNKIIRPLVNGLYYLHTNNIIHCNINLDNLLYTNDNQLIISEFSSAIDLEDIDYNKLNIPNFSLESYNTSNDIWSVGCVLYKLLYGESIVNNSSIIDRSNVESLITFPNNIHISFTTQLLIQI